VSGFIRRRISRQPPKRSDSRSGLLRVEPVQQIANPGDSQARKASRTF
jgi:hypothetical protein